MSTDIPYIRMEKKSMAMEDLLDMLQTARQKSGVVGIAQKPREQQGEILRSLMHKFDSKEDMQTVLDSKWGFGNKRKGTDPDEDVNVLECSKREK